MTLRQKMPNFICQEETSRFEGHNRVPTDLITATVRSEDGEETYTDLRRNGKAAPEILNTPGGLWSSGQFEGNLRDIFHLGNHPEFKFSRQEQEDGHAAWVFAYRIARQNEQLWQLRAENEVIAPSYEGELWVEQATGAVLRFQSIARDLPKLFPMQDAEVATDYSNVEFGDGTSFVLPVESSVATRYQGAEPTRNVMRFRGCHKFRAKTRIVLNLASQPAEQLNAGSFEDLKAELEQNRTVYNIFREQAIQEDDRRLETEHRQDLDAATVAAMQRLAALEEEQQKYADSQAANAATKSASPSAPTHAVLVFRVSVNLVPVSVVPRDAKGRAVGNLNKGNFQLFDERKPQSITRFSVEKRDIEPSTAEQTGATSNETSAVVAPILPARSVAYIFDDLHLDRDDLMNAISAAERHLTSITGPGRMALFTTSGEVGVNFTSDHEAVLAALKRVRPHPIPGWNCPPMSYYEADLIVNHADIAAGNLAEGEAMSCGHGYTEGMARRLAVSRALEVVNTGRVNAEQALGILQEVVTRTAALPGRRTIVLVSPGFITAGAHAEDRLMGLIERAVEMGIVVNTLDATGVGDTLESNTAGNLSRSQFDRQEASVRSDLMADLAYGTGGTFFHHNNNLEEGFRRTVDTPEYIYVLGFSPQKLDGKFHKLKVTLNSPEKLTVQARPGYYAVKAETNR